MLDVNILNDQDVGVWGCSEIEMSWSFQYLPPVAINT